VKFILLLLILGILLWYSNRAEGAVEAKATIIAVMGDVSVRSTANASPEAALRQQEVPVGGIIATGIKSFAKVVLPDHTQIEIGAESGILLQALAKAETTIVQLQKGDARVQTVASMKSGGAPGLQVKTATAEVSLGAGARSGELDDASPFVRYASMGDIPAPRSQLAQKGDNPEGTDFKELRDKSLRTSNERVADFVVNNKQIKNISAALLLVRDSKNDAAFSLVPGKELVQNPEGLWETQSLPMQQLVVYKNNPRLVSTTLSPIEGAANGATPTNAVMSAIAWQTTVVEGTQEYNANLSAAQVNAAGYISDNSSASATPPLPPPATISPLAATMPLNSSQVMGLNTQVHEQVITQQSAQNIQSQGSQPQPGPPAPGVDSRDLTITIDYQ
jgi:hypothetical protein